MCVAARQTDFILAESVATLLDSLRIWGLGPGWDSVFQKVK